MASLISKSNLVTKRPKKDLHIVMLIEAWFPRIGGKTGVYGGGQVHVRQLRQYLQTNHPCDIELFYPAHPNILIRGFWTFYVVIKVILHHRQHPIDIIHSHGFNSGISAKIISLIIKKPVIHTVHGSPLIDRNDTSIKAILERFILTKIKYNAQITVANSFLQHPNINTNIYVIPNGVNIKQFNQIRVNKNRFPTLIWVGRQDPVKGIHYLKLAIRKIRRTIPTLQTELVTGGRLSGKRLIKAYKKAHVFVLPSLAEGQPISLLEAWAAKLPVVVTNVGDNAKMVQDGINGYLVEPGNVNQLTEAILKVLRSKINYLRMGQSGYEYVKKHHSWSKIAQATFDVYQKLLQ